jgi:hypothetical protein
MPGAAGPGTVCMLGLLFLIFIEVAARLGCRRWQIVGRLGRVMVRVRGGCIVNVLQYPYNMEDRDTDRKKSRRLGSIDTFLPSTYVYITNTQ